MKKIFSLLVVALALFSCKEEDADVAPPAFIYPVEQMTYAGVRKHWEESERLGSLHGLVFALHGNFMVDSDFWAGWPEKKKVVFENLKQFPRGILLYDAKLKEIVISSEDSILGEEPGSDLSHIFRIQGPFALYPDGIKYGDEDTMLTVAEYVELGVYSQGMYLRFPKELGAQGFEHTYEVKMVIENQEFGERTYVAKTTF